MVLALSFLLGGCRLHFIMTRSLSASASASPQGSARRQREVQRLLQSNIYRLNASMGICFGCFLAESVLLFVAIGQETSPSDNSNWLASVMWFTLSSWLPMTVPSLAMLMLMKVRHCCWRRLLLAADSVCSFCGFHAASMRLSRGFAPHLLLC